MIDHDCLIDHCFISFVLFFKKLSNTIPSYHSDSVSLFYSQKIISENHQKMESVHKELSVSSKIPCHDTIQKELLDRESAN